MQHGLKEDPNIHYVFVVSSPECSVPILPFNNVTVVHRENYGYDFGGWGAGLKAVDVEQFDRFISIRRRWDPFFHGTFHQICIGMISSRIASKEM